MFGMRNMLLNAYPDAFIITVRGATFASVCDEVVHMDYADILILIVGINDADQRDQPTSCRGDIRHLIATGLQRAGSVIMAPPAPNTKSASVKQAVLTLNKIIAEECCEDAVSCVPISRYSHQNRMHRDTSTRIHYTLPNLAVVSM